MRVGRRVDWISCQRAASPCLLFFAVDGCRARDCDAAATGPFAEARSVGAASVTGAINTTPEKTADPISIPSIFIPCHLGGCSPLTQFALDIKANRH
jgi:hypothetical protein